MRNLPKPSQFVLLVQGPQVPAASHADELEVSGFLDDGGERRSFDAAFFLFFFFFFLSFSSSSNNPFSSLAIPPPPSRDLLRHARVLVAVEKGQPAFEGRVSCGKSEGRKEI